MAIVSSPVRMCVDFGTALSKVAIAFEDSGGASQALALRIGEECDAPSPFLVPSALFVDQDRIFLGPAALTRAAQIEDGAREELLSFKMILAARDIEEALGVRLPGTIDPTRTFTHRDAIVLFLALLLDLSAAALGKLGGRRAQKLHYTHPVWPAAGRAPALMAQIFAEAEHIAGSIGPGLHSSGGADLAVVRASLASARVSTHHVVHQTASGIFEARAAAAAHVAHGADGLSGIFIIDMGAGTTDFAGFEIVGASGAAELVEEPSSRVTASLACDEIDAIILDKLLHKWGRAKSRSSQQRLWRSMRRRARDLKEELFTNGKVSLKHENKTLTLRLNDLSADKRFTDFTSAIKTLARDRLSPLLDRVGRNGGKRIAVVLAGGGAQLACLREIATSLKSKEIAITVAPLAPHWATTPGCEPGPIDIFPQLAGALGGALERGA